MKTQQVRTMMICAAAIALAACGGGGGGPGGIGALPFVPTPPPPTPTPACPPACDLNILPSPSAGVFALVGASVAGPGGNLDTYDQPTAFGTVSGAAESQPAIRYTDSGTYEIRMPGSEWDRLVWYKGMIPDDPDTVNYFQPASVPQNYGYLLTNRARDFGYLHSELAIWGSHSAGRIGFVAFGTGTTADQMPGTGSATFDGVVQGMTDIMVPDSLYGGYVPLSVSGSVTLAFDFGQGSLDGAMTLYLPDGMQPLRIGEFAFRDTVFSVGSTAYSGAFDTSVAGQNFFLGRFTGPNAEETIGAWALPFLFDMSGEYTQADHQVHQAFGAWIARRGP